MNTRKISRRTPTSTRIRTRRESSNWAQQDSKEPISPRAVILLMLCAGPVILICASFFFGVALQALGLVGAAKNGGFLGSLGGIALTVLIASFFCLPGYLVAVIWLGLKSRSFPHNIELLKNKMMLIPLVALTMIWVPAVLVPNIGIGVRAQIGILTGVVILIFGYVWIAVVRAATSALEKIGII